MIDINRLFDGLLKFGSKSLTSNEIQLLGIDTTDKIFSKFIWKTNEFAPYYFCRECQRRHAVLQKSCNEYLVVDELNECDDKRTIAQRDLSVYKWKLTTLLRDVQQAFSDLDVILIEPCHDAYYKVGKFLHDIDVFFIIGYSATDTQEKVLKLLSSESTRQKEVTNFIIMLINDSFFDSNLKLMIQSHGGQILYLNRALEINNSGKLVAKEKLSATFKSLVSQSALNEAEACLQNMLITYNNLDAEYKKLHPTAKPPMPSLIHQDIIIHKLIRQDICYKYNIGTTKYYEIVQFLDKHFEKLSKSHRAAINKHNSQALLSSDSSDEQEIAEVFQYSAPERNISRATNTARNRDS